MIKCPDMNGNGKILAYSQCISALIIITTYFIIGLLSEAKKEPAIVYAENKKADIKAEKQKIVLPRVGFPTNLEIPKIGISAPIEYIGVDTDGKLGAPLDASYAGWYSFGYKPGENGNAVIAGHLDNQLGQPAIFYFLSSLEAGDQIIVKDDKNKQYNFIVTSKEVYDYDKAPLQEMFTAYNKPRLVLITCAGLFDYTTRNYLQRTLIYSELFE